MQGFESLETFKMPGNQKNIALFFASVATTYFLLYCPHLMQKHLQCKQPYQWFSWPRLSPGADLDHCRWSGTTCPSPSAESWPSPYQVEIVYTGKIKLQNISTPKHLH